MHVAFFSWGITKDVRAGAVKLYLRSKMNRDELECTLKEKER